MDVKKVGNKLFLPGEDTRSPEQEAATPEAPSSQDVLETQESVDPFLKDSQFNTAGAASSYNTANIEHNFGILASDSVSLAENSFRIDANGHLVFTDESLTQAFQTGLEQAKSKGADVFRFLLSVKLKES